MAEREFAADAARERPHGAGWSPGLLFFHIYRWRERLRDGLRAFGDGRPATSPREAVDDVNERELPEGAGIALDEAVTRSQAASRELIELWQALGDRPFKWYTANTTGEALLRNSYFHPRNHMAEHFIERRDQAKGYRWFEETVAELRKIDAPGHTLGPALCNLAGVRVAEGRRDEALALLREGIPMRSDLAGLVANDPDFTALRGDPRFQALI